MYCGTEVRTRYTICRHAEAHRPSVTVYPFAFVLWYLDVSFLFSRADHDDERSTTPPATFSPKSDMVKVVGMKTPSSWLGLLGAAAAILSSAGVLASSSIDVFENCDAADGMGNGVCEEWNNNEECGTSCHNVPSMKFVLKWRLSQALLCERASERPWIGIVSTVQRRQLNNGRGEQVGAKIITAQHDKNLKQNMRIPCPSQDVMVYM